MLLRFETESWRQIVFFSPLQEGPRFTRHADIISMLCDKAPSLLSTLFDGLIWRSKNVKNGVRRANYYIASFLRDDEGQLTSSLLEPWELKM